MRDGNLLGQIDEHDGSSHSQRQQTATDLSDTESAGSAKRIRTGLPRSVRCDRRRDGEGTELWRREHKRDDAEWHQRAAGATVTLRATAAAEAGRRDTAITVGRVGAHKRWHSSAPAAADSCQRFCQAMRVDQDPDEMCAIQTTDLRFSKFYDSAVIISLVCPCSAEIQTRGWKKRRVRWPLPRCSLTLRSIQSSARSALVPPFTVRESPAQAPTEDRGVSSQKRTRAATERHDSAAISDMQTQRLAKSDSSGKQPNQRDRCSA